MRSPSSRVLANVADHYAYTAAQDADGGNDPDNCYSVSPTNASVPCSAQNLGTNRDDTALGRAGSYNTWLVMVASDLSVNARDKLVITLGSSTHSLFVIGDTDGGGRGSQWQITAIERL